MKGKNLSGQGSSGFIISSIKSGFGGMMFETEEQSESRRVENTVVSGVVVDTAFTPDTKFYETGIQSKFYNNSKWIIVDEYQTRQEAVIGHKKWVAHLKKLPKKIFSIQFDEYYPFTTVNHDITSMS